VSIYCSRVTLGLDWWAPRKKGKPKANGRVAAYPQNQLARVDDPDWPDGNVDTAHIPVWCVPGHREEFSEEVAEWLRLSVMANGVHADVLIDEKAARLLVKDLQEWLNQPKAKSRPEPA
jgi:hypothetical protein